MESSTPIELPSAVDLITHDVVENTHGLVNNNAILVPMQTFPCFSTCEMNNVTVMRRSV